MFLYSWLYISYNKHIMLWKALIKILLPNTFTYGDIKKFPVIMFAKSVKAWQKIVLDAQLHP